MSLVSVLDLQAPLQETATYAADHIQTADEGTIFVDASAANRLITLRALVPGSRVQVGRIDTSAFVVTVAANGAQTIEGGASILLEDPYAMVELVGVSATEVQVARGHRYPVRSRGLYGDGVDGDVSIVGIIGSSARSMYFENLSIAGGAIYGTTGSGRIFVRNRLTIEAGGSLQAGYIWANGVDGGAGGTWAGGAKVFRGGNGGAGAAGTANGVAGTVFGNMVGDYSQPYAGGNGQGGVGGAAGAQIGGAAGVENSNSWEGTHASYGEAAPQFGGPNYANRINGGTGGGGGAASAGAGTAAGGGGGAGAGGMPVVARILDNSGQIDASGGDGGDGVTTGVGQAGGGAGGGGGYLFCAFQYVLNLGTLQANGGVGGAGSNGGTNGNAGSDGVVIVIRDDA